MGILVIFGVVSVVITMLELQRRAAILTRVYSSTEQTGLPAKTQPAKEYHGTDVIVQFDPKICIHSAECLSRLPEVFNLRNRPWVNAGGANAEAIMSTIAHCPSGALSYRQPDEGTAKV